MNQSSNKGTKQTQGTHKNNQSLQADDDAFDVTGGYQLEAITDCESEKTDGFIKDLDPLRERLRSLERLQAEKNRGMLVSSVSIVFVLYTLAGVITLFMTGDDKLLLTDSLPFTLFLIVIRYYFTQKPPNGENRS